MSNILFFLSSIFLVVPTLGQPTNGYSARIDPQQAYDFSKARSVILDQISNNQVPSISIAVVYKGFIIWEESFGLADKENNTKATIYTPYSLASVTKTITATAILQLAEKNMIHLDSPVNKYLVGAKIFSPDWNVSEVTVKKIMMHVSGLTTYDQACDASPCSVHFDTIIKRYGIIFWKPGSRFDYSNIGYGILGEIVRSISGKSLSDYFQDQIFNLLGMRNSYLNTDGKDRNSAIQYFGGPGSARVKPRITYTPGASSAYSSVHDLALFAMLHLKAPAQKGNALLTTKSIDYMKSPGADTNYNYGLGWWIRNNYYGYKGIQAQGGTTNAQAMIQMIPSEDLAVIVLSNTGRTNCGLIANETIAAVLPGFNDKWFNRSAGNSGSSPSAPESIPIRGKWSGFIRTFKEEIPVSFSVMDPNKLVLKVGNADTIHISPNYRNGRLSFKIPGNLNIMEETGPQPYVLNFTLYLRNNMELYGSVVTSATVNPATPQLPHWVRFIRLEQ